MWQINDKLLFITTGVGVGVGVGLWRVYTKKY
jgi:hypothetical protein